MDFDVVSTFGPATIRGIAKENKESFDESLIGVGEWLIDALREASPVKSGSLYNSWYYVTKNFSGYMDAVSRAMKLYMEYYKLDYIEVQKILVPEITIPAHTTLAVTSCVIYSNLHVDQSSIVQSALEILQ